MTANPRQKRSETLTGTISDKFEALQIDRFLSIIAPANELQFRFPDGVEIRRIQPASGPGILYDK